MALQFIMGNSGSGKTRYIHEKILDMAKQEPDQNFLVIVPEQFTMQTQRELAGMHERRSILNIDVLSFARLAYRVFDELGGFGCQVLEETGKNLILRRVAEEKEKELTVLKKNMTKTGYIGEVKSLISEMAQYNVTPAQLSEAIEKLPEGSFSYKLKDVLTMYRGFLDFLEGRFVTAEDVLSRLTDVADESGLLRKSVIALDGFTGFTPIQNELLKKILPIAKTVYVAVTIDIRENPYRCAGSHELFYMSKKMIRILTETADQTRVPVKEPVMLGHGEKSRFHASAPLFFLEQNLFRQQGKTFALSGEEGICIRSLKNPREELRFLAREIERLVRECGYRYREIAIVCGDLPRYANYAKEVFAEYRIPLFLDQKTTIAYHPFIEFLRSVLDVVRLDFSVESVFHYAKSPFSQIDRDEADLLENYCLAAGIRGYRKWSEAFCYLPKGCGEDSLSEINEAREKLAGQFAGLREALSGKHVTALQQTEALYRFLLDRDAQRQLKERERRCEEAGDLKNAREYAQIYRIVMDLFDKTAELLGDEELSLEEYARILDAGYEAAKVGVLPPGYDRVVFGDIERTRLDCVRALFFAGVNDGVIPRAGGADGLLSQTEREALSLMDLELAPTVREKALIQKFYLYLNLTKPSERLYLSFARTDGSGAALRSSYLVHAILKMYGNLSVIEEEEPFGGRILTAKSARELLVEGIESAAEWNLKNEEEKIRLWSALCRWYLRQDEWKQEISGLFAAARFLHADTPISASVTKALYGTVLENSVTRLEQFAACAFSHFLSYGLNLKERQESGFYAADYGTVFHEALELFAEGIREHDYSWFSITEEESEALLNDCVERAVGASRNLALYENARSSYAKERIARILRRAVAALIYQARQGRFSPDRFEVSFSYTEDLKSVNFLLGEEEKMRLKGRIDRIDTLLEDGRIYVKVIDYKSGNTGFQLLNIYHGLQLQLVVYMNAALEMMQKSHPGLEAVPAGMFYYHVKDPMVEAGGEITDEEVREKIFRELKLNGVVNEDRGVIDSMDAALCDGQSVNSAVIPAGTNKDGGIKKTSHTLSTGDFFALSSYVNETILRLGQRMMRGDVSAAPYSLAGRTGCDYCEFRPVCQFDTRMPGFSYRTLSELSKEEILEQMRGGTDEP